MPSGIINICLHSYSRGPGAARAKYRRTYIQLRLFKRRTRLFGQSLLSALQNRATAYSPPSIAALPPPTPRSPEPRCRLLTALQSRAAASSRPQKSRCCLQLPSLQGRARCRLLSTLPSLLSGAHDTPSPLPHKVHNVMSFNSINR